MNEKLPVDELDPGVVELNPAAKDESLMPTVPAKKPAALMFPEDPTITPLPLSNQICPLANKPPSMRVAVEPVTLFKTTELTDG